MDLTTAALTELVTTWLAARSADVTYAALLLLGVPVVREGAVFLLPNGVAIEIAQECSGIRSSMVLLGVGVVAGQMFLRSWWTRAALLALIVPLAIIKNGIRIVTLSLLAVYVDPGFLDGWLHHQGGSVFFAVTLVLLGGILLGLRRCDDCRSSASRAEIRSVKIVSR
jgi:exosortase